MKNRRLIITAIVLVLITLIAIGWFTFADWQETKSNNKDYYNIKTDGKGLAPESQERVTKYWQNLSKAFQDSEHNNDTGKLDKTFHDFITNKSIPRIEKVFTLWQLAEKLEGRNKYYVIDYLEVFEPVELVSEFIGTYKSSSDNYLKHKLIRIMSTALGIANPEIQSSSQLDFIAQKSDLVSNFLSEQLKYESDVALLTQALWYYPTIAPQDEALEMVKAFVADNRGVQPENIMSAWASLAFYEYDSQVNMIPQFMEELNKQPEEVKKKMHGYLYPYLQEGFINPEVKDELKNYLIKTEPEKYDPSIYNSYFIWLEDRYNWNDAYANISTTSKEEKTIFIANAIVSSNDPLFKANIITYSKPDVIAAIKYSDKMRIIEELRFNANSNAVSDDQQTLFNAAIERLEQ